jgi:hypothetical protein
MPSKSTPSKKTSPTGSRRPKSPATRSAAKTAPTRAADKRRPSVPRAAPPATSAKGRKSAAAGTSKQARLIQALKAPHGASIDALTRLTGWQPHTVRGSISGVLRKKLGLTVTSETPTEGGQRVYRIVEAGS